nr:uncharacterized protein LOC129272393 [Lytechinus pictus]
MNVQELLTEELECQWITTKKSILEEQLKGLLEEKHVHSKRLHQSKESQAKMKEDFPSSISTFIHDFGLTTRGKEHRLASVREQIKEMKVRQTELQQDIDTYDRQRRMLRCIEDEKETTEHIIATLEIEIHGVEESMVSEKNKTKKLENEKALVSGKPQSDPEFKRLQSQLEACHEESLEGLCQTLRQRVDQLQRQQWQQQLRKQHSSASVKTLSKFKWTTQPRVPPVTSPSWKTTPSQSSSLRCAPMKIPMVTAPDMDTNRSASNSSKPNLAKLTTALKCKEKQS